MGDGKIDELPCQQKPCQLPQRKTPAVGQDDGNKSLKDRPVLYAGVVWVGLVRRFLIPRSCTTSAPQRPEGVKSQQTSNRNVVEARHLEDSEPLLKKRIVAVPLITEFPEEIGGDPKSLMLRKPSNTDASPSPLTALMAQVQETSSVVMAQVRNISQELGAILLQGQGSTAELVEALRSENAQSSRLSVISFSGLIGYMIGLKRGVIPRMTYSVTGATAMATICYPEDTKTYNRSVLMALRQFITAVRSGPQTPLVMGDWHSFKISNIKISIEGDEMQHKKDNLIGTGRLQNEASTVKITIGNSDKNIQYSGNNTEECKAKLKESISNPVKVESSKVVAAYSVHPESSASESNTSQETLFHVQSDRVEDLSSKIETVANESSRGLVPDLNKQSDETTINIERPSLHSLTENVFLNKSFEENVENDDEDDDGQQDECNDDFSETVFIIPTGGLEEKLENRREHLKETVQNKSDEVPLNRREHLKETVQNKSEVPLNKKLAPYYRTLPDEEVNFEILG